MGSDPCPGPRCDGANIATGGSMPRDPACVCWVWDDRMISHVPKSKLLADCSTDVHLPWVGSNQCNCSKVRQAPSRPRSWANCSPSSLCSHRNAWANLCSQLWPALN